MRSQLKSILLVATYEKLGADDDLVAQTINTLGALLRSQVELFKPTPQSLSGWHLPKLDLNLSPHKDEAICFTPFPIKAVLLHDSLCTKAAGGHRAIYAAKGMRLYLFEDGNMELLTPYTNIDREGLSLQNELCDVGINFTRCVELSYVRMMFNSLYREPGDSKSRFISHDAIRLLCNIPQPFKRSFLIEYVLTPPDVNILSDFSRSCASIFWDICLSKDFEAEVGSQKQSKCIEILTQCAGAPAPSQLLEYIRETTAGGISDASKLLIRLDKLERDITGKLDGISTHLSDTAYWSALFKPSTVIQSDCRRPMLTLEHVKIIVKEMLNEFKSLIENQGIWKELWEKDNQPRREYSAQKLFYVMANSYCKANNLDITPESNNGVGPVDFKFSSGYEGRVLVEVKLSTNYALVDGYTEQLEAYKTAERAVEGIFLVVDVGGMGKKLDQVMAAQLVAQKSKNKASEVFYIDGRPKQSASVRRANSKGKRLN